MAAPSFSRVQVANWAVHHTLMSLVNLLNLPLPQGGFFPRRASELTLLDADVARLRMLKQGLGAEGDDVIRGYLLGVQALAFEVGFMLHQDPNLPRNPQFFADFERFSNLASQASTRRDAEEMRNLAYKLSIMLPFFEDEPRMAERNATAERWFREAEAKAR